MLIDIIVSKYSGIHRYFEKHAPHSRYFSDELGALFIYNNIEHMLHAY